jgi:hypothetical protein
MLLVLDVAPEQYYFFYYHGIIKIPKTLTSGVNFAIFLLTAFCQLSCVKNVKT